MNINNNERDLEGFLYLNPNNTVTQWNIARGAFNSASIYHSHPDNSSLLSVSMVDMLANNHNRLFAEVQIENIRKLYYPDCISRLNGLFIFDTPEDALNVMNEENWGATQLCEEDLTDVGAAIRRSSRHDSNWIPLIFNENFQLNESWQTHTHLYWRGDSVPNKQPIWELIIDGTITVWGTELRHTVLRNMQEVTYDVFKGSLDLLAYSINAAHMGSSDGELVAFLLNTGESTSIQYFMKLSDKDNPEFLQRMLAYFTENPNSFCRLGNDENWIMPDMSRFEIILSDEVIRMPHDL